MQWEVTFTIFNIKIKDGKKYQRKDKGEAKFSSYFYMFILFGEQRAVHTLVRNFNFSNVASMHMRNQLITRL